MLGVQSERKGDTIRAFEPELGERSKAFAAFKIYRDLGKERSLAAASAQYYGRPNGGKAAGQIYKWSKRFDWVERVQAFDAWQEMIAKEAVENYQRKRATEFAERQEALRFKNLENAEKAAEQEAAMLNWPLARQETIRPDKDGEMAVHIFEPAGWNKNSIKRLHDIASKAAGEPTRIDITSGRRSIKFIRVNAPTNSTGEFK